MELPPPAQGKVYNTILAEVIDCWMDTTDQPLCITRGINHSADIGNSQELFCLAIVIFLAHIQGPP